MAYATVEDVQERMISTMSEAQETVCTALLEDAAVLIDAYAPAADAEVKKVVSCRMVARAIGDGSDSGIPAGASQGSMSALGYSQSWTIGAGSVGELYLGKLEKKLLGAGNRIGSYSPVQRHAPTEDELCEA